MRSMPKISPNKWWLIAGLVFVVALFMGYGQFDKWRTAQKFAGLERDIDILMAEMQKQGITNVSKNKYCLRDGEKFGGGQLRCEINISASFFADNKNNEKTQLVQSLIASTGFKEVVPLNLNNPNSTAQYSAKTKFNCYLDVANEPDELGFIFYCIDAVNQPIYLINE